WSHLGQTCRLAARSSLYSTDSQDGHLTHRPSGTRRAPLSLVLLMRGGRSFSIQLIVFFPLEGSARRLQAGGLPCLIWSSACRMPPSHCVAAATAASVCLPAGAVATACSMVSMS